jgi:hypothetical protein
MSRVSTILGPISSPLENIIKSQPILFSLIILYQGLFSGNGVIIPERLQKLFSIPAFRLMSIMLIAFSATQDIEYAMISTLIFISILYALKTPEERKKTGFV